MGFLKFLKRSKEKEGFKFPSKEELDIPPAPALGKSQAAAKITFPTLEQSQNESAKVEEEAMRHERTELSRREHLSLEKPIFVKSNLFKAMVDELGLIKNTLKDEEEILGRLADFKQDEDKEFERWRSTVLEVQRKLIYAEKTLFS